MKKWLAIAAVLVLILAIAPLALAGGGNGHGHGHGNGHGNGHANGHGKFQLNGTVVSADAATGSLVVTVKCGSKPVKQFRGLDLTLVVAPDARMIDGTGETDVAITVADLVAGARVHVGGRIDRTDPANPVFVATKVIVQRWPAVEPTPDPTDTPTPDPTDTPTPDPTVTD
jgi:hypothetical protein